MKSDNVFTETCDPVTFVAEHSLFTLFIDAFKGRLEDLATAPYLMDSDHTTLLMRWIEKPFSVKLFPARYLTDAYAASMQDARPLHRDYNLYVTVGDRIFENSGWWKESRENILEVIKNNF